MEWLNVSQTTDHLVSLDFRLWTTPGSSICVILSKVDQKDQIAALAPPFRVCMCARARVSVSKSTFRDWFLTYDQLPGDSCCTWDIAVSLISHISVRISPVIFRVKQVFRYKFKSVKSARVYVCVRR